MTTFAHPHWFAAAALFLISSVERAAATKYSFQLGYTAVLVARVGPGWTDTSSFHSGTLKTIRLVREQPPGSRRAKVLLTPLLPIQEGSRLGSSEQIRKAIQERANSMGSNALERELKVEERNAGENRLVYFSATDPKPKPGEYLRMTEGMATFRDVPFSMTVLYDDAAARDELLDMLGRWSLYGAADRAGKGAQPDKSAVSKACATGDGLACGLLAEFFRADDSVTKSGAQQMDAGCQRGSAFACGSLAAFYGHGDGVPRDENKAWTLSQRACDGHSALGCMNAAQLVIAGRGAARDSKRQAIVDALVDRACGYGGDREGICRMSDDASESRDAADYFQRESTACAANKSRACRLLGWAHETGYGTPVDEKSAREAYGRACAAGDLWGCFRQALLTAEIPEQARLYDRACQQGSGPACYNLTLPPYGRTEPQRTQFLRQACESDIQEACAQVLAMISR